MVTEAREQDPRERRECEDDDIWAAAAQEAEYDEDMPELEYHDDDRCELEAEMANGTEVTAVVEGTAKLSSIAGEAPATLQKNRRRPTSCAREVFSRARSMVL